MSLNNNPNQLKYYIGVIFLIAIALGTYFIIPDNEAITSTEHINTTTDSTKFIKYDIYSPANTSNTPTISNEEINQKIEELEYRRSLFEKDLKTYQETYDKYNNRFIVLNRKKNTANKEKYLLLIKETEAKITTLGKQIILLEQSKR